MKSKIITEMKSFIKTLGLVMICFYFLTGYVFNLYRIDGTSMNPLLEDGQRVFTNRLSYKIGDVQRGDVVLFSAPSYPEKTFIKRVIGLPGEVVRIKKGVIYVDNRKVIDSYVPEEYRTTGYLKPVRIPLGHYFVAGDHRNHSSDSRLWATKDNVSGFVPLRYIKGKVTFRIWPLGSVGSLPGIAPEKMLEN